MARGISPRTGIRGRPFPRQLSDRLIAELKRIAQMKARIPRPKEIAARERVKERSVYYWLGKFEREARCELRKHAKLSTEAQ